jgi:hypothetical protein
MANISGFIKSMNKKLNLEHDEITHDTEEFYLLGYNAM